MTINPAVCAAVGLVLVASSAPALTFNFSFDSDPGFFRNTVDGTVSGRIVGIGPGDTEAEQIILDSFPSAYDAFFTPGQNILPGPFFTIVNEFTVVGTTLTSANFALTTVTYDFCLNNQAGVTCGSQGNELNVFPVGVTGNGNGFSGASYALAPVPLPAGFWLMLSGIGALGGLAAAKRRAAACSAS